MIHHFYFWPSKNVVITKISITNIVGVFFFFFSFVQLQNFGYFFSKNETKIVNLLRDIDEDEEEEEEEEELRSEDEEIPFVCVSLSCSTEDDRVNEANQQLNN